MSDHIQMQPPDYHRCLDTVFASPTACRELLQRLSEMTEHDIHSEWSPWTGQVPPPHGSQVGEQIPVAVQLAMLQADYDLCREILDLNVRDLAAVVGVHPMQMSYVELIFSVRRTLEDQRNRILELDDTETPGDPATHTQKP